jgi:hypothetical protein
MKSQRSVFRLDLFFFYYVPYPLQYIVSKIYNQNNYCDFYNTNNYQYHTNNIVVVVDEVYVFSAYSLNPLFSVSARSIKPLFTHLLVH